MIDLLNQKFGKLTVIEYCGKNNGGASMWLCRCDCGVKKIVCSGNLKNGNSTSCGCIRKGNIENFKNHTRKGKGHQGNGTRIYSIWANMKRRCLNSKNNHYKDYGGRGIIICNEWLGFIPFRDWALSNGYEEHLSLDRINNDDNYEPENCRWATQKEQCNNTRRNRFLTINGKTQNLTQWSEESGVSVSVLRNRIKKEWDSDKLLIKPERLILSKSQLELIKQLHINGIFDQEIADIIGFSRSSISRRIREMGIR